MNVKLLKVRGGLFLLMLGAALSVNAQVFTVLHDFTGTPDGSGPGAVVLTNGVIYGSSISGGSSNYGMIYSFSTNNGANYTLLHDFTNELDGRAPNDLISDGTTIYGMAKNGGTNGLGMIFRVGVDGLNYTNLWSFTNAAGNDAYPLGGAYPVGGLVLGGATLYGTTSAGGSNGLGTVFKIGVNGRNFSVLHHFSTNATDGSRPMAGLVLNVATLYGTTFNGGVSNAGAAFKMTTNGTSFSIIHSFTNAPDGGLPQAALTFNNNVLFGTTLVGGNGGVVGGFGSGTVFRMSTNGANYAILHHFSNVPISTNLDGSHPVAAVLVNTNLVYGSAANGGTGGNGVIFQMSTNGSGFVVLNNFTNATVGANPRGGLALGGKTLYGTSYGVGSASDNGLAFSLLLSPVITSQPQSVAVTSGSPAAFTADATGAAPLSYQWYSQTNVAKPVQPVPNATNLVLNYASATSNLLGSYFIVVTNSYGSVTSSVATLSFVTVPPPVITLQPTNVVVTNGYPFSFAAAASSTETLSYQWYFKTNTALGGATNLTLAYDHAVTNQAGAYTFVATGPAGGSVTSSVALLTVISQPVILGFNLDPSGQGFSLSLAAAGKGTNRLWATTNLVLPDSWQVIATNVMSTNGLWFFTDTNTVLTNAVRFYRFSAP